MRKRFSPRVEGLELRLPLDGSGTGTIIVGTPGSDGGNDGGDGGDGSNGVPTPIATVTDPTESD